MAEILHDSPEDIERLARALLADQLVAVPTETVYGLAGNALSETACRRIFRAKGRPTNDPLIVHLAHLEMLDRVAVSDERTLLLAAQFWPGPLTLILRKRPEVPALVTSGLETVAVRIPAHPVFQRLIAAAGIPLAAPSANPFGYISPTTSAHVEAQLGDRIDFILEGGPCPIGIESTILDLTSGKEPRILRPGAVPVSHIQTVLGPVRSNDSSSAERNATSPQVAPGLMDRHYSPTTPLRLRKEPFTDSELGALSPKAAALCIRKPENPGTNIFWFSQSGDPNDVARNLFAVLRELDSLGFASIEAEPMPGNEGLGGAINDRLRRAAGKGGREH